VVWKDDELVTVYDAKYKWPGASPSMGDVYQLVTYCTRLGITEAALVYPAQSPEKSYRVGEVTITTIGLDVTGLLGGESDNLPGEEMPTPTLEELVDIDDLLSQPTTRGHDEPGLVLE
jgi:hypothetical protein